VVYWRSLYFGKTEEGDYLKDEKDRLEAKVTQLAKQVSLSHSSAEEIVLLREQNERTHSTSRQPLAHSRVLMIHLLPLSSPVSLLGLQNQLTDVRREVKLLATAQVEAKPATPEIRTTPPTGEVCTLAPPFFVIFLDSLSFVL